MGPCDRVEAEHGVTAQFRNGKGSERRSPRAIV
jgi:hypothetical protein